MVLKLATFYHTLPYGVPTVISYWISTNANNLKVAILHSGIAIWCPVLRTTVSSNPEAADFEGHLLSDHDDLPYYSWMFSNAVRMTFFSRFVQTLISHVFGVLRYFISIPYFPNE